MKNTLIIISFTVLSFAGVIGAQTSYSNSQLFYFINYPHSVRTFGMGMQGVASTDNIDALTYNPANLVFTKDPQFSFYHNNSQISGFVLPINDYSFYYNAGKIGSFGIEFLDWDLGSIPVATNDNPDGNSNFFNLRERSFAVGYANKLSDNLSIGADFRYCATSEDFGDLKAYLFSFGINDKFNLFERNWNLSFSIMNLGPAINLSVGNYESYGIPPTLLNAGLTVPAIENNYLSVPISVSFSKPFDKYDNNGNGQSSFKSLFTDWGDFPNDASFSPGLAFEWKPINLGGGFCFSQSYYIGNYTMGEKADLQIIILTVQILNWNTTELNIRGLCGGVA